jgi:putative oxidoreductase
MSGSKKQSVLLVIRMLVGGIFLYAGLEKIMAPLDFASAIYYYRIFPEAFIGAIAAIVPWIEATCGLCLVSGFNTKGAAALSSLMLLIFISLTITSAIRGFGIDCGCFGSFHREIGLLAIAEDTLLFAASVAVLLFENDTLNSHQLPRIFLKEIRVSLRKKIGS